MKPLICAMPLALLAPATAWAVPANFGHPYPMPPGVLAAAALGQFSVGEGLTTGIGGAYGVTAAQGVTFSATRNPSGDYALGLGAGTTFGFRGNAAKLGVSAAKTLGTAPVAGSIALDVGRPLTDRLTLYSEVATTYLPGSPGRLRYASAIEYAVTRDLAVDIEYLGGLSPAGHSDLVCGDVSLSLGRGQVTATVAVPRYPEPGSPTYSLGTSWRFL
ncbi:MAG: hypothetical protein FJZ01_08995 [Candidatus Sericytochromatia bacterium]|nr:hypothetical protein [Candidatus Tanganyikabacteria bacterium]